MMVIIGTSQEPSAEQSTSSHTPHSSGDLVPSHLCVSVRSGEPGTPVCTISSLSISSLTNKQVAQAVCQPARPVSTMLSDML